MNVLALTPRGYCHGVVTAIDLLKKASHDSTIKKPITVLGMVVHNEKIVKDLEMLMIRTLHNPNKTRLELLESVKKGTVVFTAHGVSDAVIQRAIEKKLDVIDTTCSDVRSSQEAIKKYLSKDTHVLFIGKPGHPESETALSYGAKVTLISSPDDLNSLTNVHENVAVTNQTTMSLFDVFPLMEAIKKIYPEAILIEEICSATKSRQLAVMNQPPSIDHCFIVGDQHSNNTLKLVEISKHKGINASRIDSVEDLSIEYLKTLTDVSVSSGASTPSQLTQEVIAFLKQFDKDDPQTHINKSIVKKQNLFVKT